jgi:hypothetical protein
MSTKGDAPMDDNLKEPQLRALQYWIVDGVSELLVGFIFLLAAIIYYVQASIPGSLLSKILGIASVILVCGVGFGGRWIIQHIKERTTYPLTGYVAYKSGWKNKWNVVIAIVVMALLLAYVVFTTVTDTNLTNWGPVVCGLLMGALMVQAGYRLDQPRFYLLAFFGVLVGIGLVLSGLRIEYSLPLFFGLNGLVLLVSGGLTLWKYLHQTPAPQDAPDEQ